MKQNYYFIMMTFMFLSQKQEVTSLSVTFMLSSFQEKLTCFSELDDFNVP